MQKRNSLSVGLLIIVSLLCNALPFFLLSDYENVFRIFESFWIFSILFSLPILPFIISGIFAGLSFPTIKRGWLYFTCTCAMLIFSNLINFFVDDVYNGIVINFSNLFFTACIFLPIGAASFAICQAGSFALKRAPHDWRTALIFAVGSPAWMLLLSWIFRLIHNIPVADPDYGALQSIYMFFARPLLFCAFLSISFWPAVSMRAKKLQMKQWAANSVRFFSLVFLASLSVF